MRSHLSGIKTWQLILVLLLAYGLAVRIHALLAWKVALSADESVSYMCAAATAGIWETTIQDLVDRPIRMADIQRFYDRPEEFQFRTVSLDMARYDVHPPLYFWSLHIIHVCWGTSVATGAWLNVIFGLGVLLLLYRLTRELGGSVTIALAAAVVWYLSPAAVQIDLEARPYQLLALLSIASFQLGQHLIAGHGRAGTWTAFTAVNSLGLLTHLYFPFLLLSGLTLMIRVHGLRRRAWLYAGSLVTSFTGMLVFYPEFIEFVTTYGQRPRDVPEPVLYTERLKGVAYTSMQYFTEAHVPRYVFLALCIGFGAWFILKRGFQRPFDKASSRSHLLVTLAWWAGFTIVFFISGISPAQAVGEQYFAYIWPLLSIACILLVDDVLKGVAKRWVFGLYLVQLSVSFMVAVRGSTYLVPAIPPSWNPIIANSGLLITDEAKRTALPRIARDLPASLPLYIMLQDPPDPGTHGRLAFLHLDIEHRPVQPLYSVLGHAGFTVVDTALVSDRYELRSFTH